MLIVNIQYSHLKKRLFYIFLLFLSCVSFSSALFAQVPNITYPSPQTYTVNTAISSLAPTNTGGAVGTYAASTTLGSGMANTFDIAIDASGNIYSFNNSSTNFYAFNSAGTVITNNYTSAVSGLGLTGTPYPASVIFDGLGNMYFSLYGLNRVYKVNSSGSVAYTTITGPAGLAIDAANNVYVALYSGTTVSKIAVNGTSSTPGTVTANYATGLSSPWGVAVSSAGDLYVSSLSTGNIVKVPSGSSTGSNFATGFNNPRNLKFDPSGNLTITDYGNTAIKKVTPAGVVTSVAATGSGLYPTGVAYDASGTLFVSNANAASFQKYTGTYYSVSPALPVGLSLNTITGTITGTPTAVTATATYTVTARNASGNSTFGISITVNSIPVFSYPTPQFYTVNQAISPLVPTNTGGAPGSFAAATTFSITTQCNGIAVDPVTGYVYVTSNSGNTCTIYNAAGTLLFTQTGYTNPVGVAIDAAGSTYVANKGAGTVIKTTTGNVKTTITGFVEPTGVAVDGSGNLYVVDRNSSVTNGGMVYKISTSATTAGTPYITGLNTPWGITVNSGGDIFVSVPGPGNTDNRILKFLSGSTVSSVYISSSAGLNSPRSMAFDANGNMYESDAGSSKINLITAAGVANLLTTSDSPTAMAINTSTGIIYYSNYNFGGVSQTLTANYAISPTLPAGLIFNPLTGIITGTPTVSSPATNYTVTAKNASGTGTFVVNIAVGGTYDWTGASSSNFATAGNWSPAAIPGSSDVARIGYIAYTTQPSLTGPKTIYGLTFGSAATPSLTLSGALTVSSGFTILSGSNATISGGSVAVSGTSTIASTGVLTLGASTTLTNSGTFTLLSDASGTGAIGNIPSTSSVSGTFTVQRYFTGGSLSNRGYRLMSSPVNNTNNTVPTPVTNTFNFTTSPSLQSSIIITGPGGPANGFDPPAGWGVPYSATSVTILNYSTALQAFASPASLSAATPYVGTGFYFFFRGNNTANRATKLVKSGTYAVPEAVVASQTGYLNQGSITVNLNYSGSNGFNLLGNPYASTIDLTGVNAAVNVLYDAWMYDRTNNSCQAYDYYAGYSADPNITKYLASGEGFFVKATSTGGYVTFQESAKNTIAANQQTGSKLLLGIPKQFADGRIRLKLQQDSVNADFAMLLFNDSFNPKYDENEDVDDLNAAAQTVMLSSLTADNIPVAINKLPLGKQKTSSYLAVDAGAGGQFTFSKVDVTNISTAYDVWLIDHFANDSLNLRSSNSYTFTIDKANAATYGNTRFEVVIRKQVLPACQLLTFTGQRSNNANVLNWTTLNEYAYTTFTIQSSTDGKNFISIGTLQSDSTGKYTYTDKYAKTGTFYRLMQSDINDAVTYSNIIFIDLNVNFFSLYPNPATNSISFKLDKEVKSSLTLRVFNSTGTQVKSADFTQNIGAQDVSLLAPGIYTILLFDNYTRQTVATGKFAKI